MAPEQIYLLRQVQEMTFEEFVLCEHPEIETVLHNLMSVRLARNPWGLPSDLDSALEVLESEMLWFGITEEMDLSIRLFQNCFDGLRPYIKRQHNVPPEYSSHLSAATKSRLMEFNERDQRLYDFAFDLFKKRCRDEMDVQWNERALAV